jgi:hypothetical protein
LRFCFFTVLTEYSFFSLCAFRFHVHGTSVS